MQVHIEVWSTTPHREVSTKVTEGTFTFVALDKDGRKRPIPDEIKKVYADKGKA
jgi:acyl-CoA thioesterase YciA